MSCFVIKPAQSSDDSQNFTILPCGEAGELAVGGFQLARGYINRPEQTLSVFIDSPYGRVYRTGDRAVMKPDGTLECLGRLSDGQVKLRGQRIELGEIEHAALRTHGCHGACAAVVESLLVLFCAVDQGVGEDDIQSSCKSWLPQFMVPNEVVIIDEFPQLPSGKVDAKKLKDDFAKQMTSKTLDHQSLVELTQQERKVVNIISATLNQTVNLDSILAQAGLDSLSAIKLVSAFRHAGFEASATDLLKARTVAHVCIGLQRSVTKMRQPTETHTITRKFEPILEQHPQLRRRSHLVECIMACTPLQSAMLAETEQNPTINCNEILLESPSNVETQALLEAFSKVIESNEILRTGFLHWEGQHVSILFSAPLEGQVEMRTEHEDIFKLQEPDDFMRPFRVQLIDRGESMASSILIHAHHAIYDGWSMDMILSDVSEIVKGTLPQVRPQFRTVLDFQMQNAEASGDASRAFWSNSLLDWNKIPFPKLVANPRYNEIRSRECFCKICPEMVRAFSLSYGISNQVLFQTALVMAWQGITGSSDVLFGSVVSGRTIPVDGIERVVGPCIAAMPLRVQTGDMNANIDVLRRIHTNNRAIMEHCNLPLSEICKLAGLKPKESLYDVLFVYQRSLYESDIHWNVMRQVRHMDKLETKLLVEVEPLKDGFALQMTYHTDFLSPEFVDILGKQIQELCKIILADPTGPLALPNNPESLEISIYRETSSIDREPSDVAALFNTSLNRNPCAEALRVVSSTAHGQFETETLSYIQLDAVANRTAHYIRNSGAKVGDIVAIMMSKSTTLYTSILGIIRAGCAYLPILPTTPTERIKEILRQSETKYCLIDDKVARNCPLPETVTVLTVSTASLCTLPSRALSFPPDPDRLAYVIFTSGTTGVPKGVAVTQRNLASNIAYLDTIYPKSSAHPRLLQACSHAFDVSVFEIFYAWYAGMSLCAADNDIIFGDLEYWIRQLQITHLSLTPTVASLINPQNVPHVEFLVTAGEPLTMTVLEKWGTLLFQGYGPSETTNICSVKKMAKGDNIEHLGWVFPNTSVFVMSIEGLDILPRGWVGEFCFGGSQVAFGYLNDQVLTAEKFIDHISFGRIYRSGDMGRMLPDGSLVIMGRLDDQLKLRGQRIEAQEISSILTNTKLVTAAVTVLVQSVSGQSDQLATFYKLSSATESSEPLEIPPDHNQLLFATLKSRIPAYMVPSYLIPASYIPMTSSGKVDKRKLRQWFESLPKEYLERTSATMQILEDGGSWTDLELNIARAIAGSIQVSLDDIGRWTPFLALGVDSISAIALSRLLRTQLGFPVPISAILQNPTVAQLSQFLIKGDDSTAVNTSNKAKMSIDSFESEVRVVIGDRLQQVDAILPCMPLQEAMLLQGQESYYNRILLRLHVSPEAMQSYWRQMSQRHSILRTCFITTMNAVHPIAQVILGQWDLPWRVFEVTVPSLEGASQEHLDSLPEPLDSMIPPCSLGLIKYRGSNFLSFICHHALYDGIAMENLWREVEALAHGRLLQAPISYLPFLHQALSLPVDVESFWQDQFRGFQASAAFARSARSSINQCTHTISIDMGLKEIQQRTRSLGVSLLSLFQASWAAGLSCVFDDPDVAFGNVVSGRTLGVDGLQKLVAPCFNTIPLRMDTSRSAQNIDLVRAFQDLNSLLLPYQFSPLKLIQKVVGGRRRQLFDTLFLLQQPLKEMDKSIWTLEEDSGNMDVPVVCEVVPCPNLNSVVVNLHYEMDMITGDLASTVADMFKFMVRSMVLLPFGPIPSRSTIPTGFSQGLRSLVLKREKRDDAAQNNIDDIQWTELEKTIRRAIADISGVPEATVRRQTTIFQVGLDSINAVQVASMLRSQGLFVSSSDVIECSNSAKLASRISQNSEKLDRKIMHEDFYNFHSQVKEEVRERTSPTTEIEAILPCTAIQNAMLVAFMHSTEGHYLNSMSYQMQGHTDIQSVLGAWRVLQQRHPMLRTGFIPVQHPETTFAMARQKNTGLRTPVTIYDESTCEPFNLELWKAECRSLIVENLHEPPWRVALVNSHGQKRMHISIHHALYDASSLDSLLRGLAELLKGSSYTFSDIEPALSDILSREKTETSEARAFWESQATRTVVNKFPIMTPLREPVGRVIVCESISSITFRSLRETTQAIGVSVQAVLQASWARTLASYLGERSVVFGVALSGRTTDRTAHAPFPCLTTVPVIADVADSNMQLIQNMMEYNSNLHKRQFTPLVQIQKWLGYSATPVFDTILVYQKIGGSHPHTEYWKLIADDPSVDYAVSIEVDPLNDDQFCLRLTTRSDIVPKEQAELILRQFDAILSHSLRHTDSTGHEIHQSNKDLFSIIPAQTPVMTAPVNFVHQFVERNAEIQPDFPALEFVSDFDGAHNSKSVWSYKQLDDLGNQVAHMLSEFVHTGDIVAIHFPKCPEAYYSILGILKAGCSFVALDPNAPDARKEFILEDSRAACLLTCSRCDSLFPIKTHIINIEEYSLRLYPTSRLALGNDFTPDSTCYCLYTSGTTGTPKGCEITHENTVQAMMAFQYLFEGHWQHDSRWLQFASLHFDVSVLEQYWSWSVGITVVAAPKDLILDDLTGSINKLEITHIDLTPSLARLTHPDQLPNLCKGVFITGGEQLNQEILDAWGPKAVIYNAYGPTEATIGVTTYQRVPINGRPSNIGKQFPNVGSYVFCPGTETPVLKGGVGELCVSGKLVGKGYLNRPELTNERFPTLSKFKERVYRTGDLVRILHDGCFDFLGRADDQVKLRGQRLEIGEINHVIRSNTSGVKDAATLVMRYAEKDVLATFLVGNGERNLELCILPDVDSLGAKARASCLDNLPTYMVPTYFITLSHIPLSPNNKVEAKQLKALFQNLHGDELMRLTGRDAASSYNQIDTSDMATIIKVLADFSGLSVSDISHSTSIFDIGVDSISALQLSTELKSNGFSTATPAMILRSPVVSDLARVVLNKRTVPKGRDDTKEAKQALRAYQHKYGTLACRELSVKPDDIEYIAPCSPLQEGMISRAVSNNSTGSYFNWFDIEISHDASMSTVRNAWDKTVLDHPILRSVFIKTTEGYIQIALSQKANLWNYRYADNDENIYDILDQERLSWIDGNASHILSPLQFIHVEGPGKQLFRIHIFHGLYDGNSFELMNEYALRVYESKTSPPAPSFYDVLSHGPLRNFDSCKPFWTQHLQQWQHFGLPKISSPREKHENVVVLSRRLPTQHVEDLRRQENVTLQAVVLSIWTLVLQQYIRKPLTTGIIVSGRSLDLPNIENTIGPLFNTVPFFNKSLNGLSWKTLVQCCHKFNTDVLSFQHVPLRDIQKWCSGGKPLFDNLFAFQLEKVDSNVNAPPWTVIGNDPISVDYPLAFEATRTKDGHLNVLLVADTEVADIEILTQMLDQFEHIMSTVEASTVITAAADDEVGSTAHIEPEMSVNVAGSTQEQLIWTPMATTIRDEICAFAKLATKDMSPLTSILDLGMDSIDAIKISARLAKRNIKLSASQIIRQQTISAIAAAATALSAEHSTKSIITPVWDELQHRLYSFIQSKEGGLDTVEAVFPCTALQESMIAGMIHSDFQWYYNHDILKLDKEVNLSKLEDAWNRLIDQSPILRTGFIEVDDSTMDLTYCQVVYKHSTTSITICHLPDTSALQGLITKATENARCGKASSGLLQVTLVSAASHNYMVLSMAHALYDGWSLGLLYDDLEAAYRNELNPRQYTEVLTSQPLLYVASKGDSFWETYLANASPTVFKRIDNFSASDAGGIIRLDRLSSKSLTEINDFCKKTSISLQALCMACWTAVAAHLTQSLDTVFGIVLSGRDFEGADELMFPCMNTVAIRSILHGPASAFLKYMDDNLADVRENQAIPLRKAQAAANLGGKELFNSLFILQKSPSRETLTSMWKSVGGTSAVEYPVCVEAEPLQEQLHWRVACKPDFFSKHDAEAILDKLNQVLSFFMDSSETEVLSFYDNFVSVCGLPKTKIGETANDKGVYQVFEHEVQITGYSWNETARIIRKVLSDVSSLPAESISPTSTLYHLGLDSISAIKVSLLLRKADIDLKPRDLIQANSIMEITQLAEQGSGSRNKDGLDGIEWKLPLSISQDDLFSRCDILKQHIEAVIPAIAMQIYMLSAWQNSNGSVFCPEFCYEITGDYTQDQLVEAWSRVVNQVPILRTRLVSTGSQEIPWVQVIHNSNSFLESYTSLPLCQFTVSKSHGQDSWFLRLRIHHSLYDGFSLPQIMQLYYEEACHVNSKANDTKNEVANWKDYAIRPTLPANIESRKRFWMEYLAGCLTSSGITEIPTSIPYSTERVSYLKKGALPNIEHLRKHASSNGISLQSLFLAAYAKTLCVDDKTQEGLKTVIFGIYLANRDTQSDGLSAIYPTLNLVPLRVGFSPGVNLITVAAAVQKDLQLIQSDGMAHVGLWEIYNWTGIQIQTFVNFLSLLDDDADTNTPGLVRNPEEDKLCANDSKAMELLKQPWLANNVVNEAYPVSHYIPLLLAIYPATNNTLSTGISRCRGVGTWKQVGHWCVWIHRQLIER